MSQKPPVRRPALAADPGSNQVTSSGNVSGGVAPIASHIQRLRAALASLEGNPRTHTSARAILSGYYRFINPKMNKVDFPRSLRPHPGNAEHGTEGGSKYLVLYFHVGNAIEGMYAAYKLDLERAELHPDNAQGRAAQLPGVEEAVAILEQRVQLLERLATTTLDKWFLMGDDARGFHMDISRPAADKEITRNNKLFDERGELKK